MRIMRPKPLHNHLEYTIPGGGQISIACLAGVQGLSAGPQITKQIQCFPPAEKVSLRKLCCSIYGQPDEARGHMGAAILQAKQRPGLKQAHNRLQLKAARFPGQILHSYGAPTSHK
ncbi:hypothetical protein EJ03DRAFT_41608 [Teratosphaeria nubilosa]|uniref:Uncharacterized protein n=1 Tax=Teratosphaeria nubilosa TaxID=161662 RepID=A0A6G1KV84_9PEZI|nr:hypothetical protein EJ03DRAFT_41608 [Teratosphaeria nubilosa]